MDGLKKYLAAAVIVLLVGFLLYSRPKASSDSTNTALRDESATQSTRAKQDPRPSKSEVAPTQRPAADPKAALADMAGALYRFTRPGLSVKDLVSHLEQSKQDPVTTYNANPDTGGMAIVRTRRPLPGTRYFHAQYFSDESEPAFVQHMSFEFQPSPTAMIETVDAVRRSFSLPAPAVQRADYALWNLDDGRVLWVKKMALEDLQDDPFNAYTSNDVGTIRVAIEAEIH